MNIKHHCLESLVIFRCRC